MLKEKFCENCYLPFVPKRPWQKFCKPNCRIRKWFGMNYMKSDTTWTLTDNMKSLLAADDARIARAIFSPSPWDAKPPILHGPGRGRVADLL